MIILECLLLPNNSIVNTNSSNHNPNDNLTCIGSVLSAPTDPGKLFSNGTVLHFGPWWRFDHLLGAKLTIHHNKPFIVVFWTFCHLIMWNKLATKKLNFTFVYELAL